MLFKLNKGTVKHLLAHIPSTLYHKAERIYYRLKSRRSRFIDIYRKNAFGGYESISGPGSSLHQTDTIRREIPELLKEMHVESLLDAPCGDFHWMNELDLDLDKYVGIDIVPDLVKMNEANYSSERREFIIADIVEDPLPSSDLILCRDCLVHLTFNDIFRVLRNFARTNSTYLLTSTFTATEKNKDVITGFWRPLNLQREPFNFPEPLKIINEECMEQDGKYSDKCLGLWKIESLSHSI